VRFFAQTWGPKNDGENEEVIFFYGKVAILTWDLDRWRWIDEGWFLKYTIKIGRDSIINKNVGTTRAADKWQGYLLCNYKFYWSQV
jgi:hypothetical protein